MLDVRPREIQIFRDQNGREPFTDWFESVRDLKILNRIQARLDRLESGNLGDYRPVGNGVFELRFQFGPGYRIYFGEVDNTMVLLLCGGEKSSQTRDIQRAKVYWQAYKEAQK